MRVRKRIRTRVRIRFSSGRLIRLSWLLKIVYFYMLTPTPTLTQTCMHIRREKRRKEGGEWRE